MTGNAPTSGKRSRKRGEEDRGSRRNQQSREGKGSGRRKKAGSRRGMAPGVVQKKNTMELQFFILEEESKKKA